MQRRNTHERGALSSLGIAIIALIVLVGIGLFWWYRAGESNTVATNTPAIPDTGVENTGSTTSGYTFIVSSSTPASSSLNQSTQSNQAPIPGSYASQTTKTVHTTTRVYTNTAAAAASTLGGPVFHDSTYGLSIGLPTNWAGYRVYTTAGGPAGLPGTAQFHFIAPGESQDAFVINVWSKEGWNYVRNEENFVHLNTTNIGEGTYLGENFTWIYSYTLYSHPEVQAALNGAVFY